MTIPFVDLRAQYETIKAKIDRAIQQTLEEGQFVGGKRIEVFENAFASYLSVSHCIAVNSGTDALILGLRALGIQPKDEVIVPVHTFIAAAFGVSENGGIPVFVDCDNHGYGMNLSDLKQKITNKTKAIVLTHLYGQPENMDGIREVIKASGKDIVLVEDACQAHGAQYKGKHVGTFGTFAAFSFYPGKNLGAYGDGGAIVTQDAAFATRCRRLREYGQTKKYVHETAGVNSRLDAIQAAILSVKLPYLDAWNKKRRALASYYTSQLQAKLPFVQCPFDIPERESVYHLYVVRVPKRDKLLLYFTARGVQSLIHYPIPLHLQKANAYLGYKKGDFSVAEDRAGELLSLPLYPELQQDSIDYIIRTMEEFYGHHN